MFERRSSLPLFGMRMGKERIVRSQAQLRVGVPEAGSQQALPLARRPLGKRRPAHRCPDALCADHKNVITVPFLPICQGSRGKKRISILQGTEQRDVISSLAKASYSKTPPLARHPTPGVPPRQAALAPR